MDQQQVAQILQSTPATLQTLIRGLSPALHVWKPEPSEWSINEVIGHLIECDSLAFADRIQLMLAEENPEIPGVDVNAIADARKDNDADAFVLLEQLAEGRTKCVKLVLSLSEEEMERTGFFKKHGIFRVSDFVYEWAYHDHDHIQQILENVKLANWPQFSETMQAALAS